MDKGTELLSIFKLRRVEMSSLYKTPIENLKGIGKKRAELFNRLNLYSVGDVLEFYPRKYENWTDITPIELAEDGQTVCIKGTIGKRRCDFKLV